jgi:single-strand DNA-binding protein
MIDMERVKKMAISINNVVFVGCVVNMDEGGESLMLGMGAQTERRSGFALVHLGSDSERAKAAWQEITIGTIVCGTGWITCGVMACDQYESGVEAWAVINAWRIDILGAIDLEASDVDLNELPYMLHGSFTGNLGSSDPRLTTTKDGKTVCSFSMAVNRSKEETDWIKAVSWGGQAENVAKYVTARQRVTVVGGVSAEGWLNKDSGKPQGQLIVYTDNIDFGTRPNGSNGEGEEETRKPTTRPAQGHTQRPMPTQQQRRAAAMAEDEPDFD